MNMKSRTVEITGFDDGMEVSLSEMLRAREQRVERRKQILEIYDGCVITFCLNIPGPVKNCSVAAPAFYEGAAMLEKLLEENNITVNYKEYINEKTGLECFVSVSGDPYAIKKLAAGIEEEHPDGRLYDFDVITRPGRKISREEVGLPPRRCFICSEPAFVCARSRRHTENELKESILKILNRDK